MSEKKKDASAAQEEYCRRRGLPYFAPRDGLCPRCGRNIYDVYGVELAGRELITGCPWCGATFVD